MCIRDSHRGTALSLGSVECDEIVCGYHGWHYDVAGRCTLIPQLETPTRVPSKARVAAFRCTERHGLIWVALAPPSWDLPEVPELESEAWRAVECGPYAWEADASRQLENFTDFGHFPWVHPGLSVSYTHLDVYKRQAIGRVRRDLVQLLPAEPASVPTNARSRRRAAPLMELRSVNA